MLIHVVFVALKSHIDNTLSVQYDLTHRGDGPSDAYIISQNLCELFFIQVHPWILPVNVKALQTFSIC